MVELHVFDGVADALHGLLPDDLGPWRQRNHRYGIKLWFGTAARPEREHYEAQVVGPRLVPDATVLAIEIGFHAEHPDPAANTATLDRLVAPARARCWRRDLGHEPVAGPFLGREGGDWMRLSETWIDPDLSDPELAFEVAARLVDYAVALEPLRRR
jgi:hypothetical protein